MKKLILTVFTTAPFLLSAISQTDHADQLPESSRNEFTIDETNPLFNPHEWMDTTTWLQGNEGRRSDSRLTEDDYREVAAELDVEVAAIKAVVDIEAGKSHNGFWTKGKPLINFDLSMYRRFAPKHGVLLSAAKKKSPEIFSKPNIRRYGSYQAAQQARLNAAMEINKESAIEATFWGMFQIGGFNWKKCGTDSITEFMNLMSRSERDQLELFAHFIRNGGMVEAIRQRNWLGFALKYNGPQAKARGYHTRLSAAYKRHKAEDAKADLPEKRTCVKTE